MNENTFTENMNKLKENFGEKAFSKTRIDLIWNMSKRVADHTFDKICHKFLVSSRYAPMPADFSEQLELEKKLAGGGYNFPSLDQLSPFPNSVFSKEEIAEFFDVMRALATGKMKRSEGEEYAKMVQRLMDERKKL